MYSKFKLAINKVGKYVMRVLDPTAKKQKCACGKNPTCLCVNKMEKIDHTMTHPMTNELLEYLKSQYDPKM